MSSAARRDYDAMVVPEVPGVESRKPVIQAAGVFLGDGTLSCRALVAARHVPAQRLTALLLKRHREPVPVLIDWTPVAEKRAHGDVRIDLAKE